MMPAPSTTTLGGVEAVLAVTHKWISAISTSGVPTLTQPATTDISGLGTIATQASTAVAITGGTLSGLTSIVAKSIASTPYALTYAASLAINLANGLCQTVTLTGNPTITFSGAVAGAHYLLELTQDSTGSRTVTWGTTIRWQGGSAPTLTTTPSKTDLIVIIYDGTSYFGQVALDF